MKTFIPKYNKELTGYIFGCAIFDGEEYFTLDEFFTTPPKRYSAEEYQRISDLARTYREKCTEEFDSELPFDESDPDYEFEMKRVVALGTRNKNVIVKLATDDDWLTRCHIAVNPATDDDILYRLSKDTDNLVLEYLATRKHLPQDIKNSIM